MASRMCVHLFFQASSKEYILRKGSHRRIQRHPGKPFFYSRFIISNRYLSHKGAVSSVGRAHRFKQWGPKFKPHQLYHYQENRQGFGSAFSNCQKAIFIKVSQVADIYLDRTLLYCSILLPPVFMLTPKKAGGFLLILLKKSEASPVHPFL